MTTGEREETKSSEPQANEKNVKQLLGVQSAGPSAEPSAFRAGSGDTSQTRSLSGLAEDLPSHLPPRLLPFRDPRHRELIDELEQTRIVLLVSFEESAAYAAAYSLVKDDHFSGKKRKAFFPTRGRDRDRGDLDVHVLAEQEFLGDEPQILLIEINGGCPLFDSAMQAPLGITARITEQLQSHSSYLVLVVNEDLFGDRKPIFPSYSVSHFLYLLTPHAKDRAAAFEQRLHALAGKDREVLRELYQSVAACLEHGVEAVEEFLVKREQDGTLPRSKRLEVVTAEDVFPASSEIHRAVTFVATYLPDLGQRDFDRLVLTLLGDRTTTEERVRQVVSRDNTVTTVCEEIEKRWSELWRRDSDAVFEKCRLRPVVAADGSWIVDFTEPYLRREIRAYLERHHSWYLRRQCQILKESGVLFALDLSSSAVDGLVQLFVERAVVDPSSFGSLWLLDMVHGLRIQLNGDPPDSPDQALDWLLQKLAAEARLRAHFFERLARLIRAMLDSEPLRRLDTVGDFLEYLLNARQHAALLEVVLDLARRLRFAPHFDSLRWMRRLLDEGNARVRELTADVLITLARESGPRVYEFLATIREWSRDSSTNRFSTAVALEFPFAYCVRVAMLLSEERFGEWPSRHPLFYALPAEKTEARREIATVVDWVLDPRGADLETADPGDPTQTADAVRIGYVADLVEHWALVLEGTEGGTAEGRAVFDMILDEICHRSGARERAWIQRSWQRRQDDYLARATSLTGADRVALVKRRTKLDQLRKRLAANPTPKTIGGMAQ